MHYERRYEGPTATADALADLAEFLGPALPRLVDAAAPWAHDRDQFHLACSFAGVQGFPVEALRLQILAKREGIQ